MSLFGHHKSSSLFGSGDAAKSVSPPHKFDWGAAAMSFMGVDPKLFIGQRQQKASDALEQQVRAGLKARGYSDGDINVLMADPKAASALMGQVLQPRQFSDGGGSLYNPGNNSTYVAPSERVIGRDIIRTNSAGTPSTVFSGVEPVSVPDVGVFPWNNKGPIPSGQMPQQTAPPINAPTGPASGAPMLPSGPPPEAVQYLRQHPELAPHFDQKYGPGASSRILGQGGPAPAGPATFPGPYGIPGR